MSVTVEFHGAAQTVTGSQHLVKVNGRQILLDCGLYQGSRAESYKRNQQLPYNAADVDAMILSHAHIDHSGNLPNLVKSGFNGNIYCTYATRDLCAIMLRDSAKIQEYDIQFLNKKRKKGEPVHEPIYTMADADRSLNHFVGIGYGRTLPVLPGVTVTFEDAGHILGSAIVVLDIEDEETRQPVRLVFSGDLGRPDRPILRDPTFIDRADLLILESTYGDRHHDSHPQLGKRLEKIVNDTYRRGGKLIIPAFAVGRTQELVYTLHQLQENRDIPTDLPIYVDSPLAIDATSIYRLHPESYDEQVAEFLSDTNSRDPFGFEMVRYTRAVTESKELNFLRTPAVIISASGMAEAGRILHHLRNNVEDPRNTILIVGWQAPNTLGRRLVERQPQLSILGERFNLKAEVVTLNGFSAHADQGELLAWAEHIERPPRHTFLVHGEEPAAQALAAELRDRAFPKVHVPMLGQSFSV